MKKELLVKSAAVFAIFFVVLWIIAPRKKVTVVLPEGVSASQAAGILKDKGVIVSRFVF